MSSEEPTVYVVIPTYNRMAVTQRCIEALHSQTYRNFTIVIADGGSTDGTRTELKNKFKDVVFVETKKVAWWAESAASGIEWVLANSRNSDDLILLINDDIEFDENFVAGMVRNQLATGAAVGALSLNVKDPSFIVDGGVEIDWTSYNYIVQRQIPQGAHGNFNVDVLGGRASIFPKKAVHIAGNIDYKQFPHYIADYEFFYRMKNSGIKLYMTYDVQVGVHTDLTGYHHEVVTQKTMRKHLRKNFSRRSADNFFAHYRFIRKWAPEPYRAKLLRRRTGRLIRDTIANLPLLRRTWRAAEPIRKAIFKKPEADLKVALHSKE